MNQLTPNYNVFSAVSYNCIDEVLHVLKHKYIFKWQMQ